MLAPSGITLSKAGLFGRGQRKWLSNPITTAHAASQASVAQTPALGLRHAFEELVGINAKAADPEARPALLAGWSNLHHSESGFVSNQETHMQETHMLCVPHFASAH